MNQATEPNPNPLLASRVLPAYSAVKPEHVEPAVRELLAAQRRALVAAEGVTTPDLDWLRSLERITVELDRVWGPVWHLNSVVSSPPLRDALPLPAARHGVRHGARAERDAVSALQRAQGNRRRREARRAAAHRQRAARFQARRRD